MRPVAAVARAPAPSEVADAESEPAVPDEPDSEASSESLLESLLESSPSTGVACGPEPVVTPVGAPAPAPMTLVVVVPPTDTVKEVMLPYASV